MEKINSSVLPEIVDVSSASKEALPKVDTEIDAIENDPARLHKLLHHFTRDANFAISRKDRLKDLLNRRSSKKWKPEKTQKMVRRVINVDREYDAATRAITHITARLEAIRQDATLD